jgi:predicted transcriptional regulator
LSLHSLIEDLEGKLSEFEDQVDELAWEARENAEDVVYLYDGIRKAMGYTKPQDTLNALAELIDVEFKAVEERNRAEQRKVEMK